MTDKIIEDSKSKKPRSVHRPISIIVETVDTLPIERVLPADTQLTINIKFNKVTAQIMKEFLDKELKKSHKDLIVITITGVSP